MQKFRHSGQEERGSHCSFQFVKCCVLTPNCWGFSICISEKMSWTSNLALSADPSTSSGRLKSGAWWEAAVKPWSEHCSSHFQSQFFDLFWDFHRNWEVIIQKRSPFQGLKRIREYFLNLSHVCMGQGPGTAQNCWSPWLASPYGALKSEQIFHPICRLFPHRGVFFILSSFQPGFAQWANKVLL